jgi:hypothetical protein
MKRLLFATALAFGLVACNNLVGIETSSSIQRKEKYADIWTRKAVPPAWSKLGTPRPSPSFPSLPPSSGWTSWSFKPFYA